MNPNRTVYLHGRLVKPSDVLTLIAKAYAAKGTNSTVFGLDGSPSSAERALEDAMEALSRFNN